MRLILSAVTQNFLYRVRVEVGRGEVVQALVIAAMVVVVDEGGEFRLPLFRICHTRRRRRRLLRGLASERSARNIS